MAASGPWICTACTLENANPSGLACELCQTERVFPSSPSSAAAAAAAAACVDTAVPDRQEIVNDDSAVCDDDTYGANCEGCAGSGDVLRTPDDLDDRKPPASLAVSSPVDKSGTSCASNDDTDETRDFHAKGSAAGPVPRLNGGKRSAVICLDDSSSDSDNDSDDEGESDDSCSSSGDQLEMD